MTEVQPDKELAPYRPSVAGGDPRGVPQSGAADEQQGANPVELIQERMQGRWLWAILLAAVLAPMGAAAGYLLTPKQFAARGEIEALRELRTTLVETPETEAMADFGGFVAQQAFRARSDRVIEEALKDGRLTPYRQRLSPSPVSTITRGLTSRAERGMNIVTVEYESEDPGFSTAVVNSVLDAYARIFAPQEEMQFERTYNEVRDERARIQRQIEDRNTERLRRVQNTKYRNPDLSVERQELVDRLRQAENERQNLLSGMERIRRSLNLADGVEPPDDAVLEPNALELDRVNPGLAGARRQVDQARLQLDAAAKNYGERHQIRQQAKRALEYAESQLAREEDIAKAAWRAGMAETSRFGELRARAGVLQADIERYTVDIGRLVTLEGEIASIDREIGRLVREEQEASDRLRGLELNRDPIREGRIKTTLASVPSGPTKDKRIQMAAVGGMGGAGLAFGLFFLLGTIDRRTYGTAQLSTQKGKLLLAGAIPNMDEVTGDVEGTELATNCVHRIRTRIESRRTPGDGYALMLSSPFQGDGKTTVAVALAWSYAESGSRTLLVDCDFIGQALSFQFGKLGVPGVREALQGTPVSELIAPLKNEKLSVLPIGIDRAFGAARAHPAALRRLFHDLRKEFEIIIVDTGPMTASIEALPVASAVDGVLLSLKRGRSRARLEECIQDILGVGAEYLGVVLNCADKKDCIRYGSVSRLSAELSRALEGKAEAPPRHPLLNAMKIEDGGGR